MAAESQHSQASRVLLASNRGPVSYRVATDGTLTAKRGGGGLVSGLSALAPGSATWICAALSDGDRSACGAGGPLDTADTGGQAVRMLDIPKATFEAAYNGVANSVLWFIHHLLYQTPFEPAFDSLFATRWAAYEAYNSAFADALAAEAAHGAQVLVQDYHLTLVPGMLRERRPDLQGALRVFEVDHPATQAWKRERVATLGLLGLHVVTIVLGHRHART
jgi:trehalose 6-phosphate synthase